MWCPRKAEKHLPRDIIRLHWTDSVPKATTVKRHSTNTQSNNNNKNSNSKNGRVIVCLWHAGTNYVEIQIFKFWFLSVNWATRTVRIFAFDINPINRCHVTFASLAHIKTHWKIIWPYSLTHTRTSIGCSANTQSAVRCESERRIK